MYRYPLPLAALLVATLLSLTPATRAAELIPDEDSTRETGVIKNAGTRKAQPEIDAASDEAAKAAAQPDLQQKLLMVAQTAHHQSVDQFAQQVASDKTFFAALIKDLNLKLE